VTLHATVSDRLRLPLEQLSPRSLSLLERECEFPNPAYANAKRYNKGNTGALQETISLSRIRGGYLELPRGCAGLVNGLDEDVVWQDRRARYPMINIQFRSKARDYQALAGTALVGASAQPIAGTGRCGP
jgi:hypothetical protein